MKNWKKIISAGLALGLLVTGIPQSATMTAEKVYAQETGTLQNGSLTKNADGWTFADGWGHEYQDGDTYGGGFDEGYLSIWTNTLESPVPFSISQTISSVAEGNYYASVAIVGNGDKGESTSLESLTLYVKDETSGTQVSKKLTCNGWDWDNIVSSDAIEVAQGDEVTITISGELQSDEWYGIKNVTFEQQTEAVKNTPITVQKVPGLSKDFVNGVDVSSYLSLLESGVKYYDENNNEADLFDILEDAGVNYVRLRVWNDPFPWDENGDYKYVGVDGVTEYAASAVTEGAIDAYGVQQYCLVSDPDTQVYREVYGAGVCDVNTAAIIGKIATQHNMKVLIDFHYSDFWADPKKQRVPKQWEGMTLAEKKDALSDFTTESLTTLLDAGVDVGMVQVGNEINNGMAGEKDASDVYELLKSGSAAVRKVSEERNHEILVALHFTDPQSEDYQYNRAKELKEAGVDYDVFATSFYPFWHGSAETLKENLQKIADDFQKKVMVAEISYAWTMEDGDSYGNVVYSGAGDQEYDYTIDMEGQATAIRDAIAAISAIGENGLGTFYWEPAWIPVRAYDASANDAQQVKQENELAWKLYGSGWGTVYSKDFDPEIAEDERGGGTWDNQAFFDFEGHVLPSINVYKWVYTGAEGPTKVKSVSQASYVMNYKDTPELPQQVTITLNDDSTMEASVTWDVAQTAALKTATYGDYTVNGIVDEFSYVDKSSGQTITVPAGTWTTTCQVTVEGKSYIVNGSFETGDAAGWTLTNYLGENVGWPQVKKNSSNAQKGAYYFDSWSGDTLDFSIEQEIDKAQMPDGHYVLSAYYQGTGVREVSDNATLYAVVTYKNGSQKTVSSKIQILNVWKNFYQATVDLQLGSDVASVKVGTRIACTANDPAIGAWVVCDNITLIRSGEISNGSTGGGSSSGSSSGSSVAQEPVKTEDKKDDSKDNGKNEPAKEEQLSKGGVTYTVSGKNSVVYTQAKKSAKKVTIPAIVTINGKIYKVTEVADNAFKNNTKVTSVVIGSNITKIGKNAFSGAENLKTITIKSAKLTKKSVKNCLKGSSVKTIKLKGNAKKQYKKYAAYFTKANCGKKVTVKK